MHPSAFACALLTVATIVACDSPSVVGPPPPGTPSSHRATMASRPAVTLVAGMGVVDLSTAGVGDMKFSFAATQAAGASARGIFWQYRERDGKTIEFLGYVTCLAVDPATGHAWIAGKILSNSSTDPAFRVDTLHMPGMDIWFRVVDYGEGPAATQPDRSTVFGFRGSAGIITSDEYCATRPWPNTPVPDARTFPLSAGNIEVR